MARMRQQRLFAPLGMTKKPHQKTPMEFANSPRTMWHGSDAADFNELRDAYNGGGDGLESNWPGGGPIQPGDWSDDDDDYTDDDYDPLDQGFHVGTAKAAMDRLRTRSRHDNEAFLHPLQFPQSGMGETTDKGEAWRQSDHNSWYQNDYEDPGSLSAILRSPDDVTTYSDHVLDALGSGGIPSGAAEHHVTSGRQNLGFLRGDIQRVPRPHVTGDGGETQYDLVPSSEAPVFQRKQFSQGAMFENRDTFDDAGFRNGQQLFPIRGAVAPENLAAHDAENDQRQAPWVARMEREGLSDLIK